MILKNHFNKPYASKGAIALCLIIAIMLTVPISLALVIDSNPSTQKMISTIPHNAALQKTQFQINLAYAYVGPAPLNVSEYFEKGTNSTMRLFSHYPSSIRLNISRISNDQFADCDALVELYGIKIISDKGPTEYRAFFMGTNYDPSFSNSSLSKLVEYVPYLYNASLYSNLAGNFKFNWEGNTPFLTNTLGSITSYTSAETTSLGLFSAGKPNAISVIIYRIGYITITNDSVSIFEEPLSSGPKEIIQLDAYENGFLYNDLIPSAQLSQKNLFQPIA